ncbi:MAG: hypothetical protein CMC08_00360 [Flavobacteriaceae bacterium]|nr:hypothetical protein [Flavobacteriaceae bacterium]
MEQDIALFFTIYSTGPLRLLLLLLLFGTLYLLLPPKMNPKYLNGITGGTYLAILVILCFMLIQINAFDIFSIMAIMAGILLWKSLNLKWDRSLWGQLIEIKEAVLLSYISIIESKKGLAAVSSVYIRKRTNDLWLYVNGRKLVWPILLAVFITIATYFSRVFFFEFDQYTLSALWQQDLLVAKNLAAHSWFGNQQFALGEYAMLVLYKYTTNISWLAALLTFGLLESAIMAGVLFWYVFNLTNKSLFAALLASSLFCFLYGFIFVDIGTITQPKPIFFALLLFFPAAWLLQNSEHYSLRNKIISLFFLFAAMALSNLFVSVIIMPLFFISLFPQLATNGRKQLWTGFMAYVLATSIILGIYTAVAIHQGDTFSMFLSNHLYSISNYTYLPQLLIPYDSYLSFLQLAALISFVVLLFLWFRKTRTWQQLLIFHSFFGIVLLLSFFENYFFDFDLLNQVISVMAPIFLASCVYILFQLLKLAMFPETRLPLPYKLTFVVLLVGWLMLLQKNSFVNVPKGNKTTREIIQAYTQIEQTYMPYSYAIVNLARHSAISKSSHFFINYDSFGSSYLEIDALFNSHKHDAAYLKAHPEYVLPSSTFLFLYPDEMFLPDKTYEGKKAMKTARTSLSILKKRKRNIHLFYKSPNLEIYEIINSPAEGKITDLLARKLLRREK